LFKWSTPHQKARPGQQVSTRNAVKKWATDRALKIKARRSWKLVSVIPLDRLFLLSMMAFLVNLGVCCPDNCVGSFHVFAGPVICCIADMQKSVESQKTQQNRSGSRQNAPKPQIQTGTLPLPWISKGE
jgi:hypothetical protein